jgi:hypothetical protein
MEGIAIFTRATLFGLLLIACAAGLGVKTYLLWKQGPWDLPGPVKPKPGVASQAPQPSPKSAQAIVGTEIIVSKNVFDPERGASKSKEAEAETGAMQRIRSMVLLGTAILGPNRYAIVQESDGSPGVPTQGRLQTARRLRLGDMVEGFNLTEIGEKKIVFVKGGARVELPVDFFRKVDIASPPSIPPAAQIGVPGAPVAPARPGPPVDPNIARRPRLPTPPPSP